MDERKQHAPISPGVTERTKLARYRDDCPTAFSLDRRELLLTGLSLVGGLAGVPTLPATAAPPSWSQQSAAQFMEISSLLIPHRLNEEVGKRMGAAMSALNPSLSEQVTALLSIAKNKNARIVIARQSG